MLWGGSDGPAFPSTVLGNPHYVRGRLQYAEWVDARGVAAALESKSSAVLGQARALGRGYRRFGAGDLFAIAARARLGRSAQSAGLSAARGQSCSHRVARSPAPGRISGRN